MNMEKIEERVSGYSTGLLETTPGLCVFVNILEREGKKGGIALITKPFFPISQTIHTLGNQSGKLERAESVQMGRWIQLITSKRIQEKRKENARITNIPMPRTCPWSPFGREETGK